MQNSSRFAPSRWTQQTIASFYNEERIVRDQRRSIAACALMLLVGTAIAPLWFVQLLLGSAVVALALNEMVTAPRRNRATYEGLRARWAALLEQSSPAATMPTTVQLRDHELVIYARPSQRLTSQNVNGALVNRLADTGDLIVTDERVLFLGNVNTLEVAERDILRYRLSSTGVHITFEYAQRPPGEVFTVETPLFALCMERRGEFPEFHVDPPAPLPLDNPSLSGTPQSSTTEVSA